MQNGDAFQGYNLTIYSSTEVVSVRGQPDNIQSFQGTLVEIISVSRMLYVIVIKLFVGFPCKFQNDSNAFETEMKTYKLLIAASKYCAQFDSILHMF